MKARTRKQLNKPIKTTWGTYRFIGYPPGVFKIQRAIAGEPSVLVYNEDRSQLFQMPPTKQWDDIFEEYSIDLDAPYKMFVYGQVDNVGCFQIDNFLTVDPGW